MADGTSSSMHRSRSRDAIVHRDENRARYAGYQRPRTLRVIQTQMGRR